MFCRFTLEELMDSCPSYHSIMVLRLLWLKDKESSIWNMIDKLMDHLQEFEIRSKADRAVINFIREHCKLQIFSEADILHVMGLVSLNKPNRSNKMLIFQE